MASFSLNVGDILDTYAVVELYTDGRQPRWCHSVHPCMNGKPPKRPNGLTFSDIPIKQGRDDEAKPAKARRLRLSHVFTTGTLSPAWARVCRPHSQHNSGIDEVKKKDSVRKGRAHGASRAPPQCVLLGKKRGKKNKLFLASRVTGL